jgi:hypothetical protein
MNNIKTMKLALEALENWYRFDFENFGQVDYNAVAALRQAINAAEQREQAQQDVDWEKLYRLEVKKKEAIAAKYEQDIKPLTKIVPMAQQAEPVRLECVVCGTVYADGVPPQVSPPPRQPLTPERVFSIADQHAIEGFDSDIMAFARAIEAAHGIKE